MNEVHKRITKKAAHQATRLTVLKDLLTYYREITETIREPFIILDKELCVITANKAFYTKFKVKKKDTENKLIYELGTGQWNVEGLRELLEHILPKRNVLNNYEISHDFPKLGHKTMILNARQVDHRQLILLAITDVTELRKLAHDSNTMTANLIKQRDQLQEFNSAKDEFIALASHQLRTPATAVKQYIGMLTQGYAGKLSRDQMNMLNIAYESNDRQLEIIEALLLVARVDAGKIFLKKVRCDVGQLLTSIIQDQANAFDSREQSIVLMKHQPVTVFVDKKLMRMVLENLIDNAGKYTPAGGNIVVNVSQEQGNTLISIKDSGVGIRKSDQLKLFKKFSRVHNSMSVSSHGSGLGLYWCKKILDLHGCAIEVDSKTNKGSTFTVVIPARMRK